MKLKSEILSRGFTLVELMVVLSIFAILGTLSLDINNNSRRRDAVLSTDSTSFALEIRDMQNRTLSFVNDINAPAGTNGYGVYINASNDYLIQSFYRSSAGNAFTSYDIPGVSSNKPSSNIVLSNANKINKICLNGDCANYNTTNLAFSKLAIFFVKPKQYANFYISNDGATFYSKTQNNPSGIAISEVCIELNSSQNEYRNISVNYLGQISDNSGKCK